MNRKELIMKLEWWASSDVLPRLMKIIETLDRSFGLDDKYIRALLVKHGGKEWTEFRVFCYTLEYWNQNPGFDIVDKIANNISWFHMIMGVECTKLQARIEEIEALCIAYEPGLLKYLERFREYISDFCSCFYIAHPYIDIYRENAFEKNASYTINEAKEFYQCVMKATVMYILYGAKSVRYDLKPPSGHGGTIDIVKFINGGDDILGYVITHNVNCFINLAYAHIRSYQWLIDSFENEE